MRCRCGSCGACWLAALFARVNETRATYGSAGPAVGAPAGRAAARRPLPCVYLGRFVRRVHSNCDRNHVRRCDAGHGVVSQNGLCETCTTYVADA